MYLVGRIIGTHGIKGEIKIKSETNFDRFIVGNTLYLKHEQQYLPIVIASHRTHKNIDLIGLEGYHNINQVLPFIGLDIFTKHEDDLAENEFYYESLIGLPVIDESQFLLGVVEDIIEVPQGFILKVENEKKSFMVPFVDAFIKEITKDYIKIQVIEGLL